MKVVTSYINPDLDGVASAIVFSQSLPENEIVPRFAGRLNAETQGVLARLDIDSALLLGKADQQLLDDVVLVDCHHPAQLPHVHDLARVVLVIDHHPDGDTAAFPNACVQNELVGAAATLVAERVAARDERGIDGLRPEHTALLACAIASNTLDFAARSTTGRDREVFKRLVQVATRAGIDLRELLRDMRLWRQTPLHQSTVDAVNHDVKIIESAVGPLAVSQLEADGASTLLSRQDLREAVEQLAGQPGVVASLLSLVDTSAGTTTLITTNREVRKALLALAPEMIDDLTLRLNIVALRKTHLTPTLTTNWPS